MRRAFRRRCACTFERGRPGLGCLRAVCTMANRRSDRGFSERGLHGNCELGLEHGYRRRFRRTRILLRGLGGHLRRVLVGDESKLMLQVNRGGKKACKYNFIK